MNARKKAILDAATRIARRGGMDAIKTSEVARTAGCGTALIFYHFGDLDHLRDCVAKSAIARDDAVIIARLILAKSGRVRRLSREQRQRYLLALA